MTSVSTPGLGEIIEKIIGAQLDSKDWQEVCGLVEARLGATGFMLFQHDLEEHKSPVFWGSEKVMKGAGDVIEMMEHGDDNDDHEAYASFLDFPSGQLVSEYEIFGVKHDRDMPPNTHRDKVLSLLGSRSRNIARLNDVGPWMDVAALHMRCYGCNVSGQVKQEANFLLPIIGKAIEASRIIHNLSRRYGSILEIFDRLSVAAAICRPNLEVLLANSQFTEHAEERDWFVLTSNRLFVSDNAAQSRLAIAVRSGSEPHSPAKNTITSLPRRSGGLPIVVKTMSISDPDLRRGQGGPSLVLMLDPQEHAHIDTCGIAAFGLLSPAELEVCSYLVRGVSTEGIAERRNTSLVTARNQIKSILAKLGCSSRLDVTRIAMATTGPLLVDQIGRTRWSPLCQSASKRDPFVE